MSASKLTEAQREALAALTDIPGKGWLSTSASAWFRLTHEEFEALFESPLVDVGHDRGGNARVRITDAGRAALRGDK